MNRAEVRAKCLAAALAMLLAAPAAAPAKGPPIPEPDPDKGSIAVEISFGRIRPIQAFFVRVVSEEDYLEAEYVLPSNYSSKKQIYLLNARPGRYVVVAARAPKQVGFSRHTYDAYFDAEMIRQTEVEVLAGSMVFLGEIHAKYADQRQMKNADAAQAHYFRLVDPKAARRGAFSRAYLGQKTVSRVVLDHIVRDNSCERAFWLAARERAFRGERGWQRLIDMSVEGLSEVGTAALGR